jgi:hypothetical protein
VVRAPKSLALAYGRSLGNQLALEHLVGSGAGKVSGDADISWPGPGGQVGLRIDECLERIGVEGVAFIEDDRGHHLVADMPVRDGVHRDAVEGTVAQQNSLDWRGGHILIVHLHPVSGVPGENAVIVIREPGRPKGSIGKGSTGSRCRTATPLPSAGGSASQ